MVVITVQILSPNVSFQVFRLWVPRPEHQEEEHNTDEHPSKEIHWVLCGRLLNWVKSLTRCGCEALSVGKLISRTGRNSLKIAKHVRNLREDVDT